MEVLEKASFRPFALLFTLKTTLEPEKPCSCKYATLHSLVRYSTVRGVWLKRVREPRISPRVLSSRNLEYVKRILFADDSAVIRKTLRHMFEQSGWSCSEAINGQDAIEKAQEFTPDVIALDLSMPIMNGLAAGNILRQIAPSIPLILFTSFGGIINSEDLRRAGFSALISKNDPGMLAVTAQTLLDDCEPRKRAS